MRNFKEGVKVTTAYGHEPLFAGTDGNIEKTIVIGAPGAKVTEMTLFSEFLVVKTVRGSELALPITNFKTFVLAKDASNS